MEAPRELAQRVTPSAARGRQGPVVRSALTGVITIVLGMAAHAVSGGALPSVPIIAALAALAVLVATLVAQLKLPAWGVMLVLGGAQQVLHWVLGGLGGAASSTFFGSTLGHHAEVPVGVAPSSGHSPEVMMMLHLHLAAALLTGWLVVRHALVLAWLRRTLRR